MSKLADALLDPTKHYSSPEDVLDDRQLSKKDKIAILEQWVYDARELEVADEENMQGNDDDLLDKVLLALRELKADADIEHTPPTKHG